MNALVPQLPLIRAAFILNLPRPRRFLRTFPPFTFYQPLQPDGLQFMPLGANLLNAYFH